MNVRRLVLVAVGAVALVAGCSTPPGQSPGMGGSSMGMGSSGGMGMGGPGSGMGMGAAGGGDQAQMCGMYRQMMAGKTPAEQQAAMEAHMKSMHGSSVTPERTRMHREMMEKNCAGMPANR